LEIFPFSANRFNVDVFIPQKVNYKVMEEVEDKKIYTEEERLALAAKLDDDLDAFINSLEKKRYTEGWPADQWEKVRKRYSQGKSHVTPDNFRKWNDIPSS
jgi:hypothetical protein